jgi:WD40 repeat protein
LNTNNVKSFTINPTLVPKVVHQLFGHEMPISCVAIMTELDLAVSGSLDGTVNVYTIEEGQYVRTLKPLGCSGMKIEISYITISYQGWP